MEPSKYHQHIVGRADLPKIDVYDVLVTFNVTNPGLQHAIKKMLMPGARGGKSKLEDLTEAAIALGRAIEIERGIVDDVFADAVAYAKRQAEIEEEKLIPQREIEATTGFSKPFEGRTVPRKVIEDTSDGAQ